ncbi:MAG: hypothetical protein IK093_09975 [Ruminiclostridium sp.]|nr:hypothetical protein [Ruminiclostridium sp.]
MDKSCKKAAVAGIVCVTVYFLSVTMFLVTKAGPALTLWELMTVAGAAVMLVSMTLISDAYGIIPVYRRLLLVSLSGTLIITSVAHFTSIGVVRVLADQGEDIPEYFKIGTFPSLEMTLDYTAWGFFMGAAFIIMFMGIKDKGLRIISLVCGLLCLTGFTGSFFNENLWYAAPFGYGFGFTAMCIYVLKKGARADISR